MPGGSVAEPHAVPDSLRPARPQNPLRGAENRGPRTVRLVWPAGDRADRAAGGRSVVEAVLAAGSGPGASTPTTSARAWRRPAISWKAFWGLETLEVPQSWVCTGEAFQWFVAHLLARLPEFRAVYNEALREYRRLHRVRSRFAPGARTGRRGAVAGGPVVGLDGRRARAAGGLFARAAGRRNRFSPIGNRGKPGCRFRPEGDAGRAVERLMELQRGGVRIRPRALVTTLWARLALGDLFIHGIGGAKYDCVTDRLIERFFGLAAPRFLVVSATLHLPIERDRATADDVRHDPTRTARHDVPSRAVSRWGRHSCLPRRLGNQGRQDVRMFTPHGRYDCRKAAMDCNAADCENARQRCQAIRRINAALQPWLDDRRRRLAERLAETSRRLQAESVLAWREYAFCLYPESTLREFCRGYFTERSEHGLMASVLVERILL